MWLELFNDLRKKSGMSLDEISAKSGVPKGTLAKITSGVTKAPPLETMRKLVHSMGYTLNDIDPNPAKKAPDGAEAGEDPLQGVLLENFGRLNQEGREKLVDLSDDLVSSGKYIKSGQNIVGGEKMA